MNLTSPHTHDTAETRFVEADGVTYAYRRFGDGPGHPLLFLQHLRGSMDYWDPAVTDGLAAKREVILFDNEGVGRSSGETPDNFDGLADNAARFTRALGFAAIDVLGFSIGGHTAQTLALRHPELVRRLVVVGSKPRAGTSEGTAPDVLEVAGRHEVSTLEDFLYLFFAPTQTSQAAGRAFWERRHRRAVDPDHATTRQTFEAQRAAIIEWQSPRTESRDQIENITAPTLFVNGSRDIMAPTVNSYVMAQRVPDAQLIVYPDSGHGSLFQFPATFVGHVAEFLDRPRPIQESGS